MISIHKAFSGSFSNYWNEISTIFFIFFPCQNNEISIHILCPQSGLKHSVVHSQVIGVKFQRFFFKIFLCQNNEISIHILCPQSGLKWPVQHRIRFPLKGVLGGEWSPGRAARARQKSFYLETNLNGDLSNILIYAYCIYIFAHKKYT